MSFHLLENYIFPTFLSGKEQSDVIGKSRSVSFMLTTLAYSNSLPYIVCQYHCIDQIYALSFLFAWSTDWPSNLWIVHASVDPCFEQRNPWIVHIHSLHIILSYTCHTIHDSYQSPLVKLVLVTTGQAWDAIIHLAAVISSAAVSWLYALQHLCIWWLGAHVYLWLKETNNHGFFSMGALKE